MSNTTNDVQTTTHDLGLEKGWAAFDKLFILT